MTDEQNQKNNYYEMKKYLAFALLCLLPFGGQAENAYNVRDYGATGDGRTLDSPAINRAIEECASHGGGTVTLTAGHYLSGSIRMKSNVCLNIEAGATIVAISERTAYDPSEPFEGPEYQDGGHTYFHNSLIWADGEQNISIIGRGTIDGSGLTKHDTETAGQVHGGSIGTGDKSIALKLCRNILIRDVTITRGGHFAIIITGCELGTIDNVTIDTNRDGIDIDCCKMITVSNTKVNTPSDDGIVLKSSYANGGYRNIAITNCSFLYSSGLALEEVDQGMMENIVVSNLTMNHVHHYPIYITTGCRNRGPKENTAISSAQDIQIMNVTADDCDSLSGIQITGMPGHPIKNVRLSNIQLRYRGGMKQQPPRDYPELGTKYPEIAKFLGTCPAYGLFARHVDGLQLRDITIQLMAPDVRPCIITDDVKNLKMENVIW